MRVGRDAERGGDGGNGDEMVGSKGEWDGGREDGMEMKTRTKERGSKRKRHECVVLGASSAARGI